MKVRLAKRAPYFNHAEARKAYDWVIKNYDEACAVLPMVLFERVQNEIFDHRDEIQKGLLTAFAPELEAIAKAAGADEWDRDARGRFSATESRRRKATVTYDRNSRPLPKSALKVPQNNLKGAQRRRFEQAYSQVAQEMQAAIENGFDTSDSYVTALYRDPSGNLTREPAIGLSPARAVNPEKFKDGGRLVAVTIDHRPPLSVAGAGYDLMTGLSDPATAERIGQGVSGARRAGDEIRKPGAVAQLATGRASGNIGEDTTTTRAFNRLRAAADLATVAMGDSAPAKLRLAAATASFVGEYGPEAEKVLGPTTRRASYRYRGTEKRPDPALQKAVNDAIRAHTKDVDGGGMAEARSNARHATVYGWRGQDGRHVESPLVRYFQSRLPDPGLYELQVQSGTLPPSQGVIIDRHGRVSHEAVGYGEDWYLPFNLTNLKALKGGEYVRTRAYGGLTTEDIYTGLVSGARSVTVVSNSGVFTVEFDDTFRGGRRLNDKAARMVGRYGQLLDAVKNGEIAPGDIDPRRRREIETAAASRFDPVDEKARYETEVKRGLDRERLNPTLSAAEREEIVRGVLDEAAHTWAASQGLRDVNNLEDAVAAERAARARRAAAMPGFDLDASMERDFGGEAAIDFLGARKAVDAALAARERELRAQVTPLRLDGTGYKYAQDALAEQFPYYIARKDARGLGGRNDKGYVKPRFNRPAAARSGYFDPSITGKGKTDADRTAFQNYGVARPAAKERDTEDAPAGTAPSAGAPAATPPAPAAAKKEAEDPVEHRDAVLEVARQVRIAPKIGANAEGTVNNVAFGNAPGGVIGEKAREQIASGFPHLLDPDLNVKWGNSAFRAAVLKEIQQLADAKAFDIDFAAALNGGKPKKVPWSIDAARTATADTDFDFPGFDVEPAGSDALIGAEYLARLEARDDDVQFFLRRTKADTLTGDARLSRIIEFRNTSLDNYARMLRQRAEAQRNDSYRMPSAEDFADAERMILGADKLLAIERKRARFTAAAPLGPEPEPDVVHRATFIAENKETAQSVGALTAARGAEVIEVAPENAADIIRQAGGGSLL